MIVYMSAAAVALFYAYQVPVRVAVMISFGAESALTISVGVFEAGLPYKKRIPFHIESVLENIGKPNMKGLEIHRAAALLKDFIRQLQIERIRIHFSGDTGDAMRTAMLSGLLSILASVADAVTGARVDARIAPDFHGGQLMIAFGGIASMKLGHIIRALTQSALQGRIMKWNTIQSKTS